MATAKQDTIKEWVLPKERAHRRIRLSLATRLYLKGYVRSDIELSATTGIPPRDRGTIATLTEANLMVDVEELDDVAETEGWLLVAADSFEED